MVVWLIGEDGRRIRAVDPFVPTCYLAASPSIREQVSRLLRRASCRIGTREVERYELGALRPIQVMETSRDTEQLRTHQDIASQAPSAALTMQVSTSAGSGMTISVYESIELVTTTPNGHAYLDGIFSWEPLAVQLKRGKQPC